MSNLLETGAAFLQSQMIAFASSEITYRRGAQSVVLSAILGSTKVEIVDDGGSKVGARVADFIVPSADLVLGGALVLPERGDVIESGGYRYEVLFLGGDGCWRYGDAFGKSIRIHTKLVE